MLGDVSIMPSEMVALVADATEVMSLSLTVDIPLYAVVSDAITLFTLLRNELVSVTPWLATAVLTPDTTETNELYWISIEARRESMANALTEQPVL